MAKAQRKTGKIDRDGVTYRIFDDVLALATTLLRGRKDSGAGKLRSLAEATRGYAASMTDLPNLQAQVASASEGIEGLADYVLHTDVEHMAGDAVVFAKRQPLASLAIAVAAGVVASRLMRSPRPEIKVRARATPARNSGKKKSTTPSRKTNGSTQPHV
jgi:hypothetical protein